MKTRTTAALLIKRFFMYIYVNCINVHVSSQTFFATLEKCVPMSAKGYHALSENLLEIHQNLDVLLFRSATLFPGGENI